LDANATRSVNDKALQQARVPIEKRQQPSQAPQDCTCPLTHLLLLTAISEGTRSRAWGLRGMVSSVTCHVTWRSWNSRVHHYLQKHTNVFRLRAQACDCIVNLRRRDWNRSCSKRIM